MNKGKVEIEKATNSLLKDIFTSFRIRSKVSFHKCMRKQMIGYSSASRKLLKIIGRNGFEFSGSGAFRMCLKYGKYAIKFDISFIDEYDDYYNDKPYNENRNELRYFRKIRRSCPGVKFCMLPIIHSFKSYRGIFVIISPLLEVFKQEDNRSRYGRFKYKIICMSFTDSHNCNLGMYNKEPFILDYNVEEEDEYYRDDYLKEKRGLYKQERRASLRLIRVMEGMLK